MGIVLFATKSPTVLACASCGSGGGDPLILYPNEPYKSYFGLTYQNLTDDVDQNRNLHRVIAPDKKIVATLAGGLLLTSNSFVTLTTSYQSNYQGTRSVSGFGDPSLMGRLTVLPQSFERPYVPQVQIMAGYKPSVVPSIHTQTDLLKVMGNGFDEYKAGLDIWYGMELLKAGLAQLFVVPRARHESDGSKNESGITSRTTLTLGREYSSAGKVLVGLNRQVTGEKHYQGDLVPDSKVQDHSLFITADYMLTPLDTLRLTYVRTALLPSDVNTTVTQSLIIAMMSVY